MTGQLERFLGLKRNVDRIASRHPHFLPVTAIINVHDALGQGDKFRHQLQNNRRGDCGPATFCGVRALATLCGTCGPSTYCGAFHRAMLSNCVHFGKKTERPGMIALTAIRYSGRWQGNLPFCSHRGMGWSRNGRSRAGGRAHVVNLAEPGADRGEYPSQTQCRRWGTEGAKNGAGEPGGPEFFRQKRCRLTWRCAQASSRRFRIIANRWFARLFGPGSAAPPRTPPRRQG